MTKLGRNLARIRKEKGYTQQKLGEAIGVTQRVITYFERTAERIPADKLAAIAEVLGVTGDEILGIVQPKRKQGAPQNAYLRRKLTAVERFKKNDQRLITNMIEKIESSYKMQSVG